MIQDMNDKPTLGSIGHAPDYESLKQVVLMGDMDTFLLQACQYTQDTLLAELRRARDMLVVCENAFFENQHFRRLTELTQLITHLDAILANPKRQAPDELGTRK